MFSMGFSSDGLSWVKRLRQKLETSCNDYVYACNQYANTAGGRIKKICDEVYEEKNKLYDVSEESSVEPDCNLSDCDRIQPLALGIFQSSSACQVSRREKIECEKIMVNQLKLKLLTVQIAKNKQPPCLVNEESGTTEIYGESTERYRTAPGSPAYVQNVKSLTEGMEEIIIKDLDDDDVENEITLIAQRAAAKKNMSLMRKVTSLFISKKGYYKGAQSDICPEMQNRDSISSSTIVDSGDSFSKWELTQVFCDDLTGNE